MSKKKGDKFIWKNKPIGLKPIICHYCKEVIPPENIKHPRQKFCCDEHRSFFNYDKRMKKYKLKVWELRICVMCGKKFIPHIHQQICCKASCSSEYQKRYQRTWKENNKNRLGLNEKCKLYMREKRKLEKEERTAKRVEERRVYNIQPSYYYG